MCGIAGFIQTDGSQARQTILKKMTDAISHRGPDGEGHWIEGPVAIGHRRLAVIDISEAASQPMVSMDHRYILSYNGELYNYKELRHELEAIGYWFRSNSDTEVLLCALSAWGKDALLRFNGMFALALWDRKEGCLLLARDRFGIKPLYYAEQNGAIYFASEQKAIYQHPGFDKHIDKPALLEYFTFQNIFTDRTLVQDVKLLPAGNYITFKMSGQKSVSNQFQYWDYHFQCLDENPDYGLYTEELDALLQQAVKRQMVSDVEVGAYLSGGMDSGALTALASKQVPYIKSFTVGFDLSSASGMELAFDERSSAEAMSARFKTEHYEMVLKSGDMERCLPRFTYHLEEPRVGQSYPNFYAALLASKFVKVVLSGVGGDELFGGYPWRYYRVADSKDFEHYIDQYFQFWQRLVPKELLNEFLAPVWSDVKDFEARDIFRNVFLNHQNELHRPEDYINHSLYFESKTFLHGLFVVEDKLSMAHGLESRVPFMDNDLVDFAMRCPVDFKLNNLNKVVHIDENKLGEKQKYFMRSNDGKRLLRDAMKRHIPNQITENNKQGFSSPDASWFKGESIDFVRKKLLNDDALIFQWLDKKTVHSMVNEHLNGEANRRLLVWSLLNVEQWASHF